MNVKGNVKKGMQKWCDEQVPPDEKLAKQLVVQFIMDHG